MLTGIITQMDEICKRAVTDNLNCDIINLETVSGGDFAQSYKAYLTDGRQIFIKTHQNPPAFFFSTEAVGLQWLRSSGHVNVPNVLSVSDEKPHLAMEWVEIGSGNKQTEENFGRELAALHKQKFKCFGRPDKRTTGSQAVPNLPAQTWVEFYSANRLRPLAKMAKEKNALPATCIEKINTIAEKIAEFGASDEPASLLHGDLWAGNRVIDVNGNSWLIDPAAHGGHREFDLAMMQLFGGYGQACFAAYNEDYPLQKDWQSRVALHQLAPLIVHAIKFGGAYVSATQSASSQYA